MARTVAQTEMTELLEDLLSRRITSSAGSCPGVGSQQCGSAHFSSTERSLDNR